MMTNSNRGVLATVLGLFGKASAPRPLASLEAGVPSTSAEDGIDSMLHETASGAFCDPKRERGYAMAKPTVAAPAPGSRAVGI